MEKQHNNKICMNFFIQDEIPLTTLSSEIEDGNGLENFEIKGPKIF